MVSSNIPLGKVSAAERSEGLLHFADTAWQRCSDLNKRVLDTDATSVPKVVQLLLESGLLDTRARSVFSGASLGCRAATILGKDTITVRYCGKDPSFDTLSALALWILVNSELLVSLKHLVIETTEIGQGIGRQGSTVLSALAACASSLETVSGSWLHPDSLQADIETYCESDVMPWSDKHKAVWEEESSCPAASVLLLPALLAANMSSLTLVQCDSQAHDVVSAAKVLDLRLESSSSPAARVTAAAWAGCLQRSTHGLNSLSMQWNYDMPAPTISHAQLVYDNRQDLRHLCVLVARGAKPFTVDKSALGTALLQPVTKPFAEAPGGHTVAPEVADSSLSFTAAEGSQDPALQLYAQDEVGVLPAVTMPETFPALWCRGLETFHVHVSSEHVVTIAQEDRAVWSLHDSAIPVIAATIEANTSTLKHLSITGTLGANHVLSHSLMSAIARCRLQSLSLHLSFPWQQPEAFAWSAQLAGEDMASAAQDSKEEESSSEAPSGLFTDWRRDVCPDVQAAVKAEGVFADDLQTALQQQGRSLRKLHLTVNSAPDVAAFNMASKNLKRISDLSVSIAGRLRIDPCDECFRSVEWPVPGHEADDASTTTASTLVQTYDAHSFWSGSNIPASLMATVATSGGGEEEEDEDEGDEGEGKDEDLWDEDEDEDEDGESESKFSASLVGSVGRPFSAKSKGSRPFSARSRGSRPFSARSRGRPVSAKERASQALTRPKRKTFPKGNVRNYAARRLDTAALLAHTLRTFPTGLRSLPISVQEGSKAFPAYAHKWWWGCYLDAMRTHATTLVDLTLSGSATWCSGTATVLLRKLFRTADCSVKRVHLTLPAGDTLHPLIPHLLAEGLEGLTAGLQSLVLDRASAVPKLPAAPPATATGGSSSPSEGTHKQLKAGIGSFQGSHIGSEVSAGGELQEAGDLAPLLAAWRPIAGPHPACLRLLWDLTPAEVQAITDATMEFPESTQLGELELHLGGQVAAHRPVPEVLQDLFETLAGMPQARHMHSLALHAVSCNVMGQPDIRSLLDRLRWLQRLTLTMSEPLGATLSRERAADQASAPSSSSGASAAMGMVNAEPVPTLKELQGAAELSDMGYELDPLLVAAGAAHPRPLVGAIQAVAGLLLDLSRDSVAALHTARTARTTARPGKEFAPMPADIDLSVDVLDLPPQHKWVSPWALRLVDSLNVSAALPSTVAFLGRLSSACAEVCSAGLPHKVLMQAVRGLYPHLRELRVSVPVLSATDVMALALALSADAPHELQLHLQVGAVDDVVQGGLAGCAALESASHDLPLDIACEQFGGSAATMGAYRRLYSVEHEFVSLLGKTGCLIVNPTTGSSATVVTAGQH